jgi:DNA transposition AAA+ family ATPase
VRKEGFEVRTHFVRTENIMRFEGMCRELESKESLIGPSLAMLTGPAGRGKSAAAERYASQTAAVYIAPMCVRTPLMVLRDICFELAALKPGRTDGCLELISDEMERNRRLVMVDEADLLEMRTLEMLRNLNERTGCPVLLIGEDGLISKVESRRRISSRLRRRMTFGPVTQADMMVFFKNALDQELSPETVKVLHRASGGDWRPILKMALDIERAMTASSLKKITTDLATQAAEAAKGNGR